MAMLESFLLKPTIICRNWIFWRELFVGFEYFGANYLSDLSILARFFCRNWIFWRELFVGFGYFSVNYLSDLDI